MSEKSYTNHSSFWDVAVFVVCCNKSFFIRLSDTWCICISDGLPSFNIWVFCEGGGILVSRHRLKFLGMVCDPLALPNFPAGHSAFPDVTGSRVSRGNVDDTCLDEPFDSSVVWWTKNVSGSQYNFTSCWDFKNTHVVIDLHLDYY